MLYIDIIPFVLTTIVFTIANVIMCNKIWKIHMDRLNRHDVVLKEINERSDHSRCLTYEYFSESTQRRDEDFKMIYKKELQDEVEQLELKIKTLRTCFELVLSTK